MDDRERVQAGHLRELPAGTQYRAGGSGGPGRTPEGHPDREWAHGQRRRCWEGIRPC